MLRWTQKVDGGPRRVNHAAIAVRNRFIFSFGGYCTGDDYNTIEKMDIHVFDLVLCRWTKLKSVCPTDDSYNCVPYMRYGHSASVIKDIVYIFGGRNDTYGACNTIFCFDTLTMKWSKPAVQGSPPAARDGHSACVIDSKIYIFGGYEEQGECFSNQVEYLDTRTMRWHCPRVKGSPANWRDFHSASAVGSKMYIFGGRGDRLGPFHSNNEVYSNIVAVFDTIDNRWTRLKTSGTSPIGRRSHSAVVYGKNIYIFGGYNGLHRTHYGDMNVLDTENNRWTLLNIPGSAACPRRRHCCCLIQSQAVLFGGTSPKPGAPPDDEYGLQEHSDLYVLDFRPSLKTLCKVAVVQYRLDHSCLPWDLRLELSSSVETWHSSSKEMHGSPKG